MERRHIILKNELNIRGSSCSGDSILPLYLKPTILKFNHRYNTNISFYKTEVLKGDLLKKAREILHNELEDLIINYHIDADPEGFGRCAEKVVIFDRELILNLMQCEIDKIIYRLNNLIKFLDESISRNGEIEILGVSEDILFKS